MGGIFGGLVGLADLVGGSVLFLLVGSAASRENKTARWFRVIFGSCVTAGLGTMIANLIGGVKFLDERGLTVAIWFPIAFVLGILLLEVLRTMIDGE